MENISDFIPHLEGDSPVLNQIGWAAYKIYENSENLLMWTHLLLAALFPIYIGSHAALRRPSSAATPKKALIVGDTDDDDDFEEETAVEGLSPSDAIMFPLLAGCTLGGLYLIIKWLKDPALLNKILGWYFSALGVFGVGKLLGDTLNVGTSFVFPSVWSSSNGQVYHINTLFSGQSTKIAPKSLNRAPPHEKLLAEKTSPLPGTLSKLKFSESTTKKLWATRKLFLDHWIFRAHIHGLVTAKSRVRLNDVIGLVLGFTVIVLYNVIGKEWWLTNLMAFGFCYGTLQLMSPTTFWTGTLVLIGLFFYDIYMVFYTPLMVTVATSLDVPIKLVFPGPKRGSMLGLGDVVLPGIMMALALRFDLYLHYLRLQTKSTLSSTGITKAPYQEATSRWGERFWTRSAPKVEKAKVGSRFSKVYFYASMIGYVIGMLTTLTVLNVFNHAQPALLYLVPGVLISLWSTALFRGELKLMWNYTEDSSAEEVGKDDDKGVKDLVKDENKSEEDKEAQSKKAQDDAKTTKVDEHSHHVFLFSLSTPKQSSPTK